MTGTNEPEFRVLDNNFIINNGTLLEWLKENARSASKLSMASAYFYNLLTPENPDTGLFESITSENPALEITLVISDRLSPDLVQTLMAWVKKEPPQAPMTVQSKFLEILQKLNLKIFVITQGERDNPRFFHPKLYIFHDDRGPTSFCVGSGNLTPSGLTRNIELMLCDTEPLRCSAFRGWFNALLLRAQPLSEEILKVIKTISPENVEVSCESAQMTSLVEPPVKIPISIIKLTPDTSKIDISVKQSGDTSVVVIKGLDYYDSSSATVTNIEQDRMLAWCIGQESERGQFVPLKYAKIALDPAIERFFNIYGSGGLKGWISDLQSNYRQVERGREMTIGEKLTEIVIQVLTEIGIVFQGTVT